MSIPGRDIRPVGRTGIDWAKLCPAGDIEITEIRQVQGFADLPDDVQKILSEHSDVALKGR